MPKIRPTPQHPIQGLPRSGTLRTVRHPRRHRSPSRISSKIQRLHQNRRPHTRSNLSPVRKRTGPCYGTQPGDSSSIPSKNGGCCHHDRNRKLRRNGRRVEAGPRHVLSGFTSFTTRPHQRQASLTNASTLSHRGLNPFIGGDDEIRPKQA